MASVIDSFKDILGEPLSVVKILLLSVLFIIVITLYCHKRK